MIAIEYILLIASILILVSISITRFSENLGVPTLLLFLAIGMLAGSEGPGGITFDDPNLAQSTGIIALAVILFAGGLETKWRQVRPVLWQATSLATLGVFITALAVGIFAVYVLGFSLLHGLLLGAIISSTDAAAVFAVLRSRNVSLRGNLRPLLELESGSNDPMAVFLTIGLIRLITVPETSLFSIVTLFLFQMGLGAIIGYGMGKVMVLMLNRLRLSYEGMYPVFSLAFTALIYGATASLGGSGFLAVYISGITVGHSEFVHKRSLLRFFDGLAWLSQIAMFITLGLLVYPTQILTVLGTGLLVSGFLMIVARPLSVFLSLGISRLSRKEKIFASWVGLRGAVPIVLATFPLIAGLPDADLMFNLVFFIVLTSTLLQGSSIPALAKWLKVEAPREQKRRYPIEFAPLEGVDTELVDLIIPYNAGIAGKTLVELGLPQDTLIVLISRDDAFIVPSGGTVLNEGDTILVLVNSQNLPIVRDIVSELKDEKGKSNEG